MRVRRGQTIIEYVVLIVIVIAALVTMQVYMKRGVQGRWKAAVDDLGEQYNPETTKIDILYNYDTASSSELRVETVPGKDSEFLTMRYDNTTTSEKKTGVWTTPLK